MEAVQQGIPVVDLAPLAVSPTDPGTIRALVAASHEIGFCYLVNHGIDAVPERDAFAAARAFFALSDDDKRAVAIENSPHFRGYTPAGHEYTRGAADWREQFDLGADEAAVDWRSGDPAWRRLRGPNQWPRQLPGMADAIAAWSTPMARLALQVLHALAAGLGQPADSFDACLLPRGDPHLKLIRYRGAPEMPAGPAGGGQGVGWHHDSGLLTFIVQDGAPGLQVRTSRGIVSAEPRPGSCLMNLGEMLQRATAGYLRATEHRVVSPPDGAERISLAYFAHPKLESHFEPVGLPPELAARAPGGDNADPGDPVHRCFGDNYLKIRLRSHPTVAERFYADVLAGR